MFVAKDKTNWLVVIAVAFFAGAVGAMAVLYINDTVSQSNCMMQLSN